MTRHAWLARAVLLASTVGGLWLSGIADERFDAVAVQAQRFDLRLFLATITPLIVAGACASAAARVPWPPAGFAWRRLWLVPIGLFPAIHLALLRWAPQLGWVDPGWFYTYRWFDEGAVPAVAAGLVGAVIGGAFGGGRADIA